MTGDGDQERESLRGDEIRPGSGFEAKSSAKSCLLNSLKLLTGVETNPLPDKDEEDEKQEDHEVKDVEAGPIRNEV